MIAAGLKGGKAWKKRSVSRVSLITLSFSAVSEKERRFSSVYMFQDVQFLVRIYVLMPKYKSIVIMAVRGKAGEREIESLSSKVVKGSW